MARNLSGNGSSTTGLKLARNASPIAPSNPARVVSVDDPCLNGLLVATHDFANFPKTNVPTDDSPTAHERTLAFICRTMA